MIQTDQPRKKTKENLFGTTRHTIVKSLIYLFFFFVNFIP